MLGKEVDALAAVQEAFVRALTHLPGLKGRSFFKTWLLRVVSNASLDLGRARGRREALSFDAMAQQHREDLEPLVEDAAGQNPGRAGLRRLLPQALRALAGAQRPAFVLPAGAGPRPPE